MCAGCASPHRALHAVRGPRPRIEEVRLEGVKRFSKQELLAYLHANEHSWSPLAIDSEFDDAVAAVDAQRIEQLYGAFGYRQARVSRLTAVPHDGDSTRVDVVVRVEEGLATRVSRMDIVFVPSSLSAADERDIAAAASLKLSGPFEMERLNASLGDIRVALLNRGFPLASVTSSVDLYEGARRAEVTLHVTPGEAAKIRNISFEGLYRVPREKLDVEVRFAKGERYSPALTRQIEEALVALRVFRWVAVVPPSSVDSGHVDLVVRVSESDARTIAVGPQIGIDSVRWQQQLVARYTDVNLFGELTRLDLDAAVGYAEIPNFWATRRHGVVASVSPTFTKKGIAEDFLVWSFAPMIGVDVQEGYDYWITGERLGVSRWFGGKLNLSLSHNLSRYDYFAKDPALDPKSTSLGRDFRDPYLLSYLESKNSLYLVDSIPNPTSGAIFDAVYDLAGGPLFGDYDFQKASLSARGYYRPAERWQFVARVQGGSIFPFGAKPSAPLSMKYYQGGANAMRGFGSKRLSPVITECAPACTNIPIGGYSMVQGTLELRFNVAGPFSVVGFAEFGDVKAASFRYDFATWNYTAGPGLRLKTPLGLVRGDIGFRLNRLDAYPGERSFAFYVGLGEAL